MTKHKHAEMIKAKTDNMDLVVFVKAAAYGGEWFKIDQHDLPTNPHQEYFMSHPKHEKECLHWLNGGVVAELNKANNWFPLTPKERYGEWSDEHLFMDGSVSLRIKPHKEKRWIAIDKNGYPASNTYKTKDAAKDDVINPQEWQFIEIEVEVKS